MCCNPKYKYPTGRGSLCFHALIFSLSIFQDTKSEKFTKPSDVLQMLAQKVFRLDTKPGGTLNVEVIGMLVGNFFGEP